MVHAIPYTIALASFLSAFLSPLRTATDHSSLGLYIYGQPGQALKRRRPRTGQEVMGGIYASALLARLDPGDGEWASAHSIYADLPA